MIKIDLLRRIENMMEEFTKSQKVIASYIVDNPEQVTRITVTELAKKAKSSPASVMRFCDAIQVDGFSQLKVELAASLSNDKPMELEIRENEPLENIKRKLLEAAYQAMEDTINYMSEEVLKNAKKLINDSEVLYTFGAGASYLVAENIAQKWNRVGKVTINEQNIHALAMCFLGNDKPKALILISHTGETKEALQVQALAKQHKVPVISITQFGTNTLSTNADVAIKTFKSNENPMRSAATSSLHSQFITVDVLFYYYISTNYDQTLDKVRKTNESIQMLNE